MILICMHSLRCSSIRAQCKDALAKTAGSKVGSTSGEIETQNSNKRGWPALQSASKLEVTSY